WKAPVTGGGIENFLKFSDSVQRQPRGKANTGNDQSLNRLAQPRFVVIGPLWSHPISIIARSLSPASVQQNDSWMCFHDILGRCTKPCRHHQEDRHEHSRKTL